VSAFIKRAPVTLGLSEYLSAPGGPNVVREEFTIQRNALAVVRLIFLKSTSQHVPVLHNSLDQAVTLNLGAKRSRGKRPPSLHLVMDLMPTLSLCASMIASD
jgi:hypothetical protein